MPKPIHNHQPAYTGRESTHVLLLKPTDDVHKHNWENVEKSINNCVAGLNVSFCKEKSGSGVVVMGFPNDKSKAEAAIKN